MAKILVVEDDATANDYLTDAGHAVFSAYDGPEALRLFYKRHRFPPPQRPAAGANSLT